MTDSITAPRPIPDPAALAAPETTTAIVTFVALAYGWTWGLWAAVATLPPGFMALGTPLLLASAFGPSLAGMAVAALFDGRAGVMPWLRRCLRWRVGWGWYALAFLAPLVVMVLALVLHAALGGTVPASPATGHPWLSVMIVAQIVVLGGPLGEEFGWRGYALPALSKRMGWRWASLVVGVVWALWHLPLFWMAGMAQADLPMAPFLAGTVALSVVFARLSVNTGFGLLPAIVLHGAVNAGSWAIPVTPQGGELRPYLLVTGLLVATALVVFLRPGPVLSRRPVPS